MASSNATTVEQYIGEQPPDRAAALAELRAVILENLPKGFEECMGHGMAGYVVPFSRYPAGYHCPPRQPLPFIGFASQKNYISFYHMGLYASPELMEWWTEEYAKQGKGKLDMGKSCVRFKKPANMPLSLIGELVRRMTPDDWIAVYERELKR